MSDKEDLRVKIDRLEKVLVSDQRMTSKEKNELKKVLSDCKNYLASSSSEKNGISKTEKFYELIFENSPVGIVHFDEDGIVTECNPAFIKIIGSDRDSLIGLDMKILPDKRVAEIVKKSIRGEKGEFEGLYSSVTSNKITPVRAFTAPMISEKKGRKHGGIIIVEDITESHYARKKLEESELRYRSLFENDHSIMLVIDPEDGAIVKSNEAAEKFYGWKMSVLEQMNINDINTLSYEQIKKDMDNARKAKRNVFHFMHRLADGAVKNVDVYSGKTVIDGKELLLSIIHDVSERHQARRDRKKFKLGIDRSPNPVFITDVDGNIEYVNPAFEELYGYSLEETVGKNPRILKSGLADNSFYKEFWNTILAGNVAKGELVNRTKSDELVNISYSSNPIINDDGEVLGFIAIQDDITERKKMEQKIRQELKEKEILLTEIHHRVKNNLATISSMIFLQAVNENDEQLAGKLNDSGLRIKAIANIHEHLYKSKSFSKVDLPASILSLIKSIVSSLGTETDITVKNDSEKVKLSINLAINCSILINEVVSNIVKHAFRNKKTGLISLQIEEKNDALFISISDDGHPFPEDFSLDKDGKLGYTLINIMIDKIGGEYSVTNEEGINTFVFKCRKTNADQELTSKEVSKLTM